MDAVSNYEYKYSMNKSTMDFNGNLNLKDRDIGDEFMDILKNGNIRTVFQPIISLKDGRILGHEALSRGPKDSLLENPGNLFDVARAYGKLWELEFLCRLKALENISKNSSDFYVFLNVDPDIINDDKFRKGFTKEFLKNFDINPENIVFEITEKNTVGDFTSFKKTIENYKEQGYKIAIDDTGSGYSGLKLIAEIHPHYIKLDMNLIRDIDKDGLKYALIKTLYDFCVSTDIKLIAEGIETENEINTLIDIGIHYGQGYLIQKPNEEICQINPQVIQLIRARNELKSKLYYNKPSTIFVGDICRSNICVYPSQTGSEILEIFNSSPILNGLPVVDKDKLVGLVMRDKFYAKLGTQYGFALFLNRPITLVMDKHPLIVDYNTTIDVVSKQAMTRTDETLYDYIIVTRDSNYCGIVTVKDLLVKSTELEVNYAKHLNPLSGLPGNILIEQKLTELISSTTPYIVLYIDIDNFKVYNDVYGFENGDRIIQLVGRIISDIMLKDCDSSYFIGHIGGDDFVIIVENYDIGNICDSLLSTFEKGINDFYNHDDLERKYIVARNRHGVEEQYGLLSLSIAGVSNKDKVFKDIYELSEYASKVKKKCKQVWNNCYIIE